MSNDLAMTMDELELESAELLPSRETLHVCKGAHSPAGSSYTSNSFTQVASSNGLVNVLSGDNININVLGIGF
jgi:hypothetical protein